MTPTSTPTPGATRRRKQVLGGTALAAAAVLALAGPITAALAAADGAPNVQTSETVKAQLNSDGTLDRGASHVFAQVEATGSGRVSLEDPTSTSGLRNLDGWGSPTTRDGKAVYDFDVDGTKRFRTVADFTGDLPVSVDIAYTLDGTAIDPDDLAGRSGELGVSYTVTNTTAEPTEITYPDGHGEDVTETLDIVTPYVGQLALDLPDSFRHIASTDNRADQAGNGHGGRLVTWTMVLFEPIGQVEQKFGFTADVDDIAIPAAHMQVVPVSPELHPELKFGQDGFASGAQTGRDLTDGATQIDSNLLKLRDGAATLLDGLTQLQAGADQLSSGLADGVPTAIDGGRQLAKGARDAADGGTQVADGAKKVAAGNKDLAAGLGALADGAGQLSAGATELSAGASRLSTGFQDPASDADLIDGSQALAGALGLISDGLGQLNNSSSGLPAAKSGLVALRYGIDHPIGAAGAADPGGLYQGLQQIAGGLSNPACSLANPTNPANPCGVKEGLAGLAAGLSNPACSLADPTNPTNPCGLKEGLTGVKGGLDNPACDPANPSDPANPCGVKQGVSAVKAGLDAALQSGGSIDDLKGAVGAAYQLSACGALPPPVPPGALATSCDYLAAVYWGIEDPTDGLRAKSTQASGGLGLVLGGVTTKLVPGVDGLLSGVAQAQAGLSSIRTGVNLLSAGAVSARDGVRTQVLPGLDQLIGGVTSAVGGLGQLAPGAAAANVGAGDLALGIAKAGDGAHQLAGGAARLSAGLAQVGEKVPAAVSGARALAKGSAALSDGSAELAAGLNGKLAPGATQLADGLAGLQAAADGSVEIADGLAQAKDGDQQIVDGAGQLQAEGTSQLVVAGEEAAKEYGKEYAVMQALNTKGADHALPYGAPEGSSDDRGAYDISIEPVGHTGGLGSAGRGVVALVVLGLGALGATLVRGRFA